LILNPRMNAPEFMLTLCEELGILLPDDALGSIKELVDILNRYLLKAHAQGKRVVLIVDEAQNLSPELLEQIRLLTNLETETQKLLQIILIGQPELRELLARNDLRQLAQRVTARYHLDPLSREETAAYVRHRLRVAGATADIFTPQALREVYQRSGGVPRVINILCDRALLAAYTTDRHQVSAHLVARSAAEIFGQSSTAHWVPWVATLAALATLASGAWAAWQFGPWSHPAAASAPQAASGSTAAPAPAASAPGAGAAPGVGAAPAGGAVAGAITGPPGVADLLQTYRNESDTDTAAATLLGLWNANYVRGSRDACTQAAEQGLGCVNLKGSFAELRRINRPAILMLNDASGMPAEAVVTALDDTAATLQFGAGHSARVTLIDLGRYWLGNYLVLWKNGGAAATSLVPGQRGAAVRALRSKLLQLEDPDSAGTVIAKGGNADLFDKELQQMVEAFQRNSHLPVDGVAGVDTQLAVDAALAAPDTPLLQERTAQEAR
ncbi:MAG TPA: AAA family ATPase, partial [Steroidobacteraceae bacterium]|nr:AAA family ATPase [Steroidobacteraceae bacterium]